MKIRNDFVTNSSSSSYVIAYKDVPAIDKKTLAKYPFLKIYNEIINNILLSNNGCYESGDGIVSEDVESFERNFIDEYGLFDESLNEVLQDDPYAQRTYEKSIDCLNKGYKILMKTVGYSDEICSKLIDLLSEQGDNFIILASDNE